MGHIEGTVVEYSGFLTFYYIGFATGKNPQSFIFCFYIIITSKQQIFKLEVNKFQFYHIDRRIKLSKVFFNDLATLSPQIT